jgi:hypothetical protein
VQNRVVFYGLMFAQIGLVIGFSAAASRVSTMAAAAMFFGYAALTGLTFSVLFLVYTSASIATTFFITSGTFAGLSVFGAVTRRNLSTVGRFATFALIGLIIASIVNIFVASSSLMWLTTVGGVLIFAALTAYDTQALKEMYATSGGAGNLALRGLALGGVYVGGGIAPKILPAIRSGAFMQAFLDKAPMTDLLTKVPVKVILNAESGLIGAATRANELSR